MAGVRWALVVLSTSACELTTPFACHDDAQCVDDGVRGHCEATGYCSFPDPSCPSGSRYVTHAPDELRDQCVVGASCVEQVALGGAFGCLRTSQGAVWCWGGNDEGQIGAAPGGVRPPTRVSGLAGVTMLALGDRHGCAIAGETDQIWCWGANESGQAGNADGPVVAPKPVEEDGAPIAGAVALGVGRAHGCASLEGDDDIRCWGDNGRGQLGVSRTMVPSSAEPLAVSLGNERPRTLAAGGDSTCVQRQDGALACWGDNACQQLGLEMPATIESPTASMVTVDEQLALATSHACGFVMGGIECWGGVDPPTACSATTVSITPRGAVQLDLGWTHGCAAYPDGVVRCFGDGALGKLGDLAAASYKNGVDVTVPPTRAVTAGGNTSCALTDAGEVLCWGDNGRGQLGPSSTLAYSVNPVPLVDLSVVCP
jgi:alpha-tubulin suppressor-like RCC1 family protein